MRKSAVLILLLFVAAVCVAQTTSDVKDVQVARKKMQIGADTSRYFTSTATVISPASTHRQAPTAKAVYDYVQASAKNWAYRNTNTSVGSADFTVFGSLTGIAYDDIRVLRNGMEYRVGAAGCSNCQVALNTTTQTFTLSRPVVAQELIQVVIYE